MAAVQRTFLLFELFSLISCTLLNAMGALLNSDWKLTAKCNCT